jgi:hypothetical protein
MLKSNQLPLCLAATLRLLKKTPSQLLRALSGIAAKTNQLTTRMHQNQIASRQLLQRSFGKKGLNLKKT